MLPYPALGFIIAIGGINPTHNFVDLFINVAEAVAEILTCLKSFNFTNMMHLLL